MKIAVVLDEYLSHDGGAFTFQAELAHAVARLALHSQHEFVFFAPQAADASVGVEWHRYAKPRLSERVLLKLFRYWPALEAWLGWRSALEQRLRAEGIELAWFLSPRIRALGLPFIPLVLDLQHRLQPQFPEVSAKGEWHVREAHYRRALPQATAIVAGTRAGQAEIERFYGVDPARILRLPHPTPQAALEYQPAPVSELARWGLAPGYLLYPAQLWSHKNHANLIEALALLHQRGLRLTLVLTGADFGAAAAIRARIAQHNLQAYVKWLGFVEREALYALYGHALALAYVSFFGPENLPPLEAFALGCPVVAARVSGAEEQLADAALLVDPTRPVAIAAALESLHSDAALRQRLQQAGRQRAAAWTVDDFVRGALRFFDTYPQDQAREA